MATHNTVEEVRKELRSCSASLNQIGHEAHNLGQDEYAEDLAEIHDELFSLEQKLKELHE